MTHNYTLEERFWKKVDKVNGLIHPILRSRCWIWTGSVRSNRKYGSFYTKGDHREYAHRISWMIEHGEMPKGLVLHKCDNNQCVRPSHLFLGDTAANSADMVAKGRSCTGRKNGMAKLTEEQVKEILNWKKVKGGETLTALAKRLGIHQVHASYIRSGRRWGHLCKRR